MKKLLLLATIALGLATAACTEKYSHDAGNLPEQAKQTISQNFQSAVSLVKEDNEGLSKEFEVILADGCEITFNGKGDWKNIETPNTMSVPANLIPKPIKDYVLKNHKGASIVGLEKEHNGYNVELSNGVEMDFNEQGIFMKYDN